MDLKLKDKVVVISGSAGKKGSIGETMVRKFADEGAVLVILDKSDRGKDYEAQLQSKGVDAIFCKTDVTDPEQMKSAVEKVVKKYDRIDVVINNVGVNDGAGLDASHEEFMNSLKLNLVSYFLLTKYALPMLIKSKGNILNICSKVALTGQGNTSGYAASKGGVLGLTREWAVDLISHGIRVNALIIAECWTPAYEDWLENFAHPEPVLKKINTSIPLEKRMTTTAEIADTAMFLVSPRSSHSTGQFIFVDGGYVHLDRALINKNDI